MMFAQYCRIESRAGGCCSTSRAMIRAAHSMITSKGKSRECRESRHAWLRSMLEIHEKSMIEFMSVVSGRRVKSV